MHLNIHSNASYLTEPKACSCLGEFYFLGSKPIEGKPIQLNGAIHVNASVCKFVIASAAEAELGALFYNCQDGKPLRLALQELGHPQQATPIHCDNKTAVAIANNTVKKQQSRAMEMRFFGLPIKLSSETSQSHGILEKKTSLTTLLNILTLGITTKSVLGTSPHSTLHQHYLKHLHCGH